MICFFFQVYAVEGKKQKASKLQRLSSLQETADLPTEKLTPELSVTEATVVTADATPKPTEASMPATAVMMVTQNRHVKKAKLLAEHRKSAECATSGVKVRKNLLRHLG